MEVYQYKIILDNGEKEVVSINDNNIKIYDKIVRVETVNISFFTSGNIGNSRIPPRFFLDFSYHIYELVINGEIRFSILDNRLGRSLITKLYNIIENNGGQRYTTQEKIMRQCVESRGKSSLVELKSQISEHIILSIICDERFYLINNIPLEIVYDILFLKSIKFIWEPIFVPEWYSQDIVQTPATKILTIQQDWFIVRCLNSIIFLPIILYLCSLFFAYRMLFTDYLIAVPLTTSISLLYFLIDKSIRKSVKKKVERELVK